MLKHKLIRLTTVGISLDKLLEGQLAFLNKYYDVTAVSKEDAHFLHAVAREKVFAKSIPFSREISIVNDVKCLHELIGFFRYMKPLIIHSNTPKASLLSMIAGYFAKVPIRVYTVTGLRYQGETGFKRSLLLFFEKVTCYFATKVIPEGQGVKEALIANNITKKELNVIANGNINGIDVDYFSRDHYSDLQRLELRAQLSIDTNDFVFLFVGRLVADKGINELVSAFQRFQKEHTESTLLLVGPLENDFDPLSDETVSIIEKHPKIITTGYQDNVRGYFALSDAFVFPSYREGFPNVVLQAGAMELVAIVTDISGSNEIITEDENGCIIPKKNSEALQSKMEYFFSNRETCKHLGKNARHNVVKKYNQQEVWQALLNEYRSLEAQLK